MKTILERLDDYIEFANATKNFSGVGFYEDVKKHIEVLESTLSDIDIAVRKNDWPKALEECLKARTI